MASGNNAAFSALSFLTAGASFISKTKDLLDAATDLRAALKNPYLSRRDKTLQMGTGAIFLAFQSADIGLDVTSAFSGSSKWFVDRRLGVKVVTAGTGVLRSTTKYLTTPGATFSKEGLDLLGSAVLRVTAVSASYRKLAPERFTKEGLEQMKDAATICNCLAYLTMNHKTVVTVVKKIGTMLYGIIFFFPATRPARTPQANRNAPDLRVNDDFLEPVNEMRRARSIDDFRRIPRFAKNDPFLNLYTCRICKEPIRYILVVAGTDNQSAPSYYEKEEIEAWFISHPDQKPPGWPDEIAYSEEMLSAATSIQDRINGQLAALWEGSLRLNI